MFQITLTKQAARMTVGLLAIHLMFVGWLLANPAYAISQERTAPPANGAAELDEARRLNIEGEKLFDAGRFTEALALAERARALRERALGSDHPDVAATLNLLGKLYREKADFTRAEQFLQRALAIRERLNPNDPGTATTLNNLAELYIEKADLAGAEPLLLRAVLIFQKAGGLEDVELTKALNNLGINYVLRGDMPTGEAICQGALTIRLKKLDPDDRLIAESLDTVGSISLFKGDLVNAEQNLQRALAIREKVLGPDHPEVADTLSTLGILYSGKNDLVRAEGLSGRALSIREKTFGTDHPEYASSLMDLGRIYIAKGDFARAEQNMERALSIREKVFGTDHALVADTLQSLAGLKKSFTDAERLVMRALSIREKTFGPYHVVVADSLFFLGGLYLGKGDFSQAQLYYLRAASIRAKALGAMHPVVADSLLSLGNLFLIQGDTVGAEPLVRNALFIYESVYGPEHPSVALTLDKLGEMFRAKGDYFLSEQALKRALAVREKAFGKEHPLVGATLNNLALTMFLQNNYTEAEPLFQRALAILQKAPELNQASIAIALNNLGALYDAKGDLTRAQSVIQQAQAIVDKNPAVNQGTVPYVLTNQALVYIKQGNYAQAEVLLAKALATQEALFGRDHPLVARGLINMALLYVAKGDKVRALELLTRGDELQERTLAPILASGSERQKFSYLLTLGNETELTVSLHTHMLPSDPQALRLSLTTILRRKGRMLDSTTDQVAAVRRRAKAGDLGVFGANELGMLEQLSVAQSRLSALILSGPGSLTPEQYQASVGWLSNTVEQLQDAISRSGPGLKQQPVTIEQVQQSLPPRAALVEFFAYRPYEPPAKTTPQRFGPPRYVAYVLWNQGEPRWVDLGDTADIDASTTRLLRALRCLQTSDIRDCPSIADVKRLSQSVDERLMQPVRKLLGDTRHVFISPDGALNLVPFAALVDETGKYLVENYSLTYLTSGRDLLRLRINVESKEPPLIMADPAFSEAAQPEIGPAPVTPVPAAPPSILPLPSAPLAPPVGSTTVTRSTDLVSVNFSPLPGSADEARLLAALLPGARILTQDRATEAALKQVHSPSVLHIATHGFFLSDQRSTPLGGTLGLSLAGEGAGPRQLARSENPLLRSGLALTGANRVPAPFGEDGILTALEAAGLDLSGTKLVVLSACETGVGAPVYGDGVYGLRRALVLAGSESQVMSLWRVSDQATTQLMVSYYKRLLAGEGRTEALRQVQLEMLRNKLRPGTAKESSDYSHPYYWAAFIQSGDWRTMSPQLLSTPR